MVKVSKHPLQHVFVSSDTASCHVYNTHWCHHWVCSMAGCLKPTSHNVLPVGGWCHHSLPFIFPFLFVIHDRYASWLVWDISKKFRMHVNDLRGKQMGILSTLLPFITVFTKKCVMCQSFDGSTRSRMNTVNNIHPRKLQIWVPEWWAPYWTPEQNHQPQNITQQC